MPPFENPEHDAQLFHATSRIEEYLLARQSGEFLLFLFIFIAGLFFLSSGVLLHFKLLSELERERIKYRKLAMIGVTRGEVSSMVAKELRWLFVLPYMLGLLLAVFHIGILLGQDQGRAIRYAFIIGVVYMILQFGSYAVYRRFYIRKLCWSPDGISTMLGK